MTSLRDISLSAQAHLKVGTTRIDLFLFHGFKWSGQRKLFWAPVL